jgi:hypothetical protein
MNSAFLGLPRAKATLTKALEGCIMRRQRTLVAISALGLTILMSACDRQTGDGSVFPTPTTPSPTTYPSSADPRGEITVRSITPASPAQLPVSECEYAPSYNEICSKELQMAFEVQFANQVPNAMVKVDFYAGSKLCGYGNSAVQPLAAGARATFSVSRLSLEKDGGPLLCPLPAVTTRMVVRLWETTSSTARNSELLTQEFVNTYTFAEP